LDQVRKREYARLRGRDRSVIKAPKYTLLSHRDNLTLDGHRSLHKLLQANLRLNVAYLLKESFGQLWDYRRARRFFENWKPALRWQRRKPYQRFAAMIDVTGTASPLIAVRRTMSRSASSRVSTTKCASFNAVPMVCAINKT
jgi:transposase